MERKWVTSPSYEAAISVIIEARETQSISQRALAERLNKPRSFVSKIETRERRLDFVEFVAVARALGLPPSELLARIEKVLAGSIDF